MQNVTIQLPDTTTIRTVAGKPVVVKWADIPANVVAALVEGGAKIIGNNVWNGGGKDVQDADRMAALQKRLDAWKRGQYAIVEREGGQQLLTVAFEAWRAALAADNGVTEKAMDEHLSAMVEATFGKDAKRTADNKVNAAMTALAKEAKTEVAAQREAWDAKWLPIAEAKLAEEAKASAKLKTDGVKLTLKM